MVTKINYNQITNAPLNVRDYGASTTGTAAANVTAIQAAFTALSTGQTVYFPEVYNVNATLTLASKVGVKLIGPGGMTFSSAAVTDHLIDITGTSSNIVIDGLTLTGEAITGATGVQVAISINNVGTNVVSNLKVINCTISAVNVGVGLYGTLSTIKEVLVHGNHISNITGVVAGQGYGVICSGAKQVIVSDNLLDGCCRHSLYQGNGTDVGVTFSNNTILNHRSSINTGTFFAAIVVSRSSGVSVIGNTVQSFYDGGMEISHVTADVANCMDILVSGNRFINRQNAVQTLMIGEGLTPGTYNTSEVKILGNVFNDSATTSGHITHLMILNGLNLQIENNEFISTSCTTTLYQIECGYDAFAVTVNATDMDNIFIRGNTFTAKGTVTNVYAVRCSTSVSAATATTKVQVLNNNIVGMALVHLITFQTAQLTTFVAYNPGNTHAVVTSYYQNGSTAPSCAGVNYLNIANGGATTITTFNDMVVGQKLTLFFADANTTLSNTNIYVSTPGAFVAGDKDVFELICIAASTSFTEVGRSVNN